VKIVPKMHDYVLVVFKGQVTFVEERHGSKRGLEPLNDGSLFGGVMKKGGQTFIGSLFTIPLFGIPLEGVHIFVVYTILGAFIFCGENIVKHI
jgi:hypothetical protein